MSEDFLRQMADSSRERVRRAQKLRSQAAILERARAMPEPTPLVTHAGGFDLIAEVKLRSPAAGALKSGDEDVGARVTRYASAGAAAISVLTEPSRFDGSMSHLERAARALAPLRVPAMRKDFLVDPYQVIEARLADAGGVLIILRMLPRAELEALIEQALALNLFSLLEAFDEQDIELAHALAEKYAPRANADGRIRLLVGVNCRDLVTLQVVPGRLEALAPSLPTSVPRVAESGVGSAEDAQRVAQAGYQLALVGSALMTAADPHALAADMLRAGRSARSGAALDSQAAVTPSRVEPTASGGR
ncbi:MAG TPA: indole-3-glycerol-phosphate synthase [Steroidobacteraceae bacterium]|jgi:indole-3-glycerol phosphate synthase|nr:indole-3-glycerol-phosphate synthase [Steroidobacteraceae bacterium]